MRPQGYCDKLEEHHVNSVRFLQALLRIMNALLSIAEMIFSFHKNLKPIRNGQCFINLGTLLAEIEYNVMPHQLLNTLQPITARHVAFSLKNKSDLGQLPK
jgi:hypothetical protein